MAAPLFLKKGYDNVSIDEIIGVVGGSKATIYAWFGGKEGLFEAVVRQKCHDVTLAIDVDTSGTLEEQLTRIGHSFLAMVLTPADYRIPPADGVDRPDLPGGRAGCSSRAGPVSRPIDRRRRGSRSIRRTAADRRRPVSAGGALSRHADRRAPARLADLMPRAARREDKIDETVRIAVKVFLRGIAAR